MQNTQHSQSTLSKNGGSFRQVPTTPLNKYKKDLAGLWVDEEYECHETPMQTIKNIQLTKGRQNLSYVIPVGGSLLTHIVSGHWRAQYEALISPQGLVTRLKSEGIMRNMQALAHNLGIVLYEGNFVSKLVQLDLSTPALNKLVVDGPPLALESCSILKENSFLFVFEKLNKFCYCAQPNKKQQKKLSIAIFQYPLKLQSKCSKISELQLSSIEGKLKFRKLNNISLVGWIPSQATKNQSIKIVMYDLSKDKPIVLKLRKQDQQLKKKYVKISDIWEIGEGVFFVEFCIYREQQPKYGLYAYNEKNLIKGYRSFIWNYKEGVIRRTLFDIQEYHQIQILKQFRKPERKECPTYIIDMKFQYIAAISQRSSRAYQYYPEYDNQVAYLFNRKLSDDHIEVSIRKIVGKNIPGELLIADMIERMVPRCDDDLIYQTTRLIEADKVNLNDNS